MQYRTLGKTGLTFSRLGFGGIPIQKSDPDGAKALMQRMMAAGINYIDTARAYTVSESYIGQALEGIRQHFILATKSMARDKQTMARDVDISLENLRTDYIDLYQVHNPSLAQLETVCGPDGALEALLEAKSAGKIGHIGLTAHSAAVVEKALELPWVETIMFPYNIVETHGEELIRRCQEANIGFIVMKPLAGGAIDDPSLALRFCLQNEGVDVVIPGMAHPDELEQNIAACEDPSGLCEEDQAGIRRIRELLGTTFCRRCNYCAPCTAGISVLDIFLAEGYWTRYGLESYARSKYNGLSRHASDCIECGVCETRCPYHLPIREMMRHAAAKFGY